MLKIIPIRAVILVCIIFFYFTGNSYGQFQPASFDGKVVDSSTNEPLPGANITLLVSADSTFFRGTTTAEDGSFSFPRIRPASYIVNITFVGYHRDVRLINLSEGNISGLTIELKPDNVQLDELQVSAIAERMEVRGDTIAFNADAYRVNPDATAEDLVRRMPGISVEGGRVQSQGEDVRRVLVDGTEFFGDDATAALRNLPAEIIQQVEVFDRMNDQSRFTGFNDGNTELTLNIRTRPGMNHGRFGRASLSGGTEQRYMGGGNVNFFNGPQRLSVIGLTNNMNQQNFAMEDLAGVAQAPARGRGFGGGGGRGGMGGGGWGQWGGGGAAREFLTAQQSGISSVHSFGLNYTDRWNDSWNVNGSYFFNATDNSNNQSLERRFVSGLEADNLYDETSFVASDNFNHRFNARMEYTLDERNSFIFTPRGSFQLNDQQQFIAGQTFASDLSSVNQIQNNYIADNLSYNLSGSLLYRRSFAKRGRTASLNLSTNLSERDGNQLQTGETIFFDDLLRNDLFNQNTEIRTVGRTFSADLQLTEPLNERSQLLFGYTPQITTDISRRDLYQFNELTQAYDLLDNNLTSRFESDVITHRVSSGYRIGNQRFNANANLAYQYTTIQGQQTIPIVAETDKSYHNFLPRAMFMYNFSRSSNMRIFYNTNTRAPSATQLQNVVDNTNPLQLTGGNPDLDQQYTHSLNMRFRRANSEKGTAFLSFVGFNYTTNHIGNTTFIAQADTTIVQGIVMGRGARLITPSNTGNSWNVRSFFNYSLPFTLIKSNLNLFTGATYSQVPVEVNQQTADNRNLGLNAGFSMTSNISPEVDFSVSYRSTYNIVDNSLNPELDNNYYMGRARFAFTLTPRGKFVISSELNVTHYEGLSDDFNLDTWFWNASLGYKFLKSNAAELRFTVVDILGQNNSINRIIEDNYIEDVRSDVLSRYAMLTFTYNFRTFTGNR